MEILTRYGFYISAETFVYAYILSAEAMEAFVAGVFGEIKFKGVIPYVPAGPRKE